MTDQPRSSPWSNSFVDRLAKPDPGIMIYRQAAAAVLIAAASPAAALLMSPIASPRMPLLSQPHQRAVSPVASMDQIGLQIADAARPLTDEAIRAASGDLGWWGNYIKTVEDGIFTLHDNFQSAGVPYPYGFSILCFVLAVKLITLPLNWKQLSSSSQMKAMKPQQDLVKKWYGDNKDMLNMQTGELFDRYNVNPLAGCLPSLLQIPVFLGVYYSVTSIAKAKIYEEGFLWLPSLSGPISDHREGLAWLTEGWIDGVPRFGWDDTLAYLTIPLILVVTQTVSLYILGSFEALDNAEDQTSKTTGLVLRALPFMLGYFAMNAPAGLGLYWIFNNLLTTASTFTVKKLTEVDEYEVDVAPMLVAMGPRRDPMPIPESAADGFSWVPGADEAAAAADGEAAPQEAVAAAAE
jgi:YidC/Oxa1 family membrane protein insertase